MFKDSKMLDRGISKVLIVALGVLVLASSTMAETGGPSEQHVTASESNEWTKDVTIPYWAKSNATYTYYGLFLELPSTKSYSVNSNISLELYNLSGDDATVIQGVNYENSAGKLYVTGNIELRGTGWTPGSEVTSDKTNTSLTLLGIADGEFGDTVSSADITIVATSGKISLVSSTTEDIKTENLATTSACGIASKAESTSNTGNITTTATGGNVKVVAKTTAQKTTLAEVEANVTTGAQVFAEGLSCLDGAVINTGNISISASGGSAVSSATAIAHVKSDDHTPSSTVAFARVMSKSHAECQAVGILSRKSITNAGNISIVATGGSASSISTSESFADADDGFTANAKYYSYTSAFSNAYAIGIFSQGAITNTGDISITAKGGTASSLSYNKVTDSASGDGKVRASGSSNSHTYAVGRAVGISNFGGVVTNSGNINVTAHAGTESNGDSTTSADAEACGIYFRDTGKLRSTGLISASAQFASNTAPPSAGATPTAYQVICDSGTLTIEQYALEAGHSQAAFTAMYEGQIGTGSGANVMFEKTELTVHVPDDFQNGVYDIPRLWKQETEAQKAAQINQFDTAVTANQDLKVSLIPSTKVDTLQKISLEYAPTESTPLKQTLVQMNVEKQIHSIIRNNLTGQLLSGVLPASASTGQPHVSAGIDGPTEYMVASLSNPSVLPAVTTKGENPHSVFFRPVYVNSYDSASSGYSSNTYGFVLGYDYRVYEESSDCLIGVHAGYTRGDIRYSGTNYGQRKEFVDTYYGGVHGITRFAESYILSGEASFFYANSDMRDDNPARLGKADYDSVAIRAEAAIGYLWDVAEGHTLVPEIGLSYSWQHRDSFTTRNKNSADITYGSLNNNELYANGRIKWFKKYTLSPTWIITPLIGAGITQILTDGEISNSMRLGNATQLVVDQDENTTFTPEANITVSCDEYYAMAGYTGGFGGTTKNNMFWLQMGVNF